MNFTILHFDTLESTNTEAINQAKRGADEGLCVIAKKQTAGRGRHGREWISETDAGLYFSIVLRPTLEKKFLPIITLMTAVAVADTLQNLYALKTDIKWANDIHIGGKKICGILAEMIETPKGLAIITGIGINLRSSNFPAEIAGIATSVEAETDQKPEIEQAFKFADSFFRLFLRHFAERRRREENFRALVKTLVIRLRQTGACEDGKRNDFRHDRRLGGKRRTARPGHGRKFANHSGGRCRKFAECLSFRTVF